LECQLESVGCGGQYVPVGVSGLAELPDEVWKGRIERLQVLDEAALVELRAPRDQRRGKGNSHAAAEIACQVDQRRGVVGLLRRNVAETQRIDGQEQECETEC